MENVEEVHALEVEEEEELVGRQHGDLAQRGGWRGEKLEEGLHDGLQVDEEGVRERRQPVRVALVVRAELREGHGQHLLGDARTVDLAERGDEVVCLVEQHHLVLR